MQYDNLLYQTKALLHELPRDLWFAEDRVSQFLSLAQSAELTSLLKSIEGKILTVSSNCDRLSNLLLSVDPVSRRSQLRLSLDQIRHECKDYQASLKLIERRQSMEERKLRDREDLLNYEFQTNAALRTSSDSTVVKLDADVEHQSRLYSVSRRLDELISSGSESLSSLREQGMTLKTSKRRILDLLNTLGLSNTVMRLIERRTHQDKVIFWLLVCFTVFLMWTVWRFFH